ncbi:hypothetical protein JXJ21_03085 [candidate division KSB1 bacterium]|nr:hypothetical protein [candidate division KSB1 bacterium]
MAKNAFEVIILTARPAAGKSEVINYLKNTGTANRIKRFHIADFEEIDDFVYVWETFVIDDILSKHGKERLLTDKNYYFKDHFVWNLYIERINVSYARKLAYEPDFLDNHTIIIEFARGGENAIGEALSYLDDDILKKAAIFYIDVSYKESVRKNRARKRPGMEDSILYHSLPDEKMEFYYKINDWEKLTADDPEHITVKGVKLPCVAFNNESDLTTKGGEALGAALEQSFQKLWKIKNK